MSLIDAILVIKVENNRLGDETKVISTCRKGLWEIADDVRWP